MQMVSFSQGIKNSIDLQMIALIWIKLDTRYTLRAVAWGSESGFIDNVSASSFLQVCTEYPINLSNRNQQEYQWCKRGIKGAKGAGRGAQYRLLRKRAINAPNAPVVLKGLIRKLRRKGLVNGSNGSCH